MTNRLTASLRSRLTLWNAGVLAATLLIFAVAAYGFLARAAIDQLDDILEIQLQTMQRAASAPSSTTSSTTPSATPSATPSFDVAMHQIVMDLSRRGFHTRVVAGDSLAIIVGGIRLDRADVDASDEPAEDEELNRLRLSPATQQRIVEHIGRRDAFDLVDARMHLRARVGSTHIADRPVTLVVAAPLGEVHGLLKSARGTFVVAIPIVLVIAAAIGYGLARRSLSPIAAMTAQAERINARTLHERLPVPNVHDELGRLATAFNLALDRIDVALEQQRRFTADASHELRTPVAVIRTEADVALDGDQRSLGQYRDALVVIRDGSEQLSRIVNDLFLLARADAGQIAAAAAPVYFDELVADTVRGLRSLAARRDIDIQLQSSEELLTWGDEALLRRIVVNLLDNAIKYAPSGSTVFVHLRTTGNEHRLTVTDGGPGVPLEAQSLIFDRFYRADAVRGYDDSGIGTGAGLGLSIAREIASLHRGTVALSASRPGETTFEVILPDADQVRSLSGAV